MLVANWEGVVIPDRAIGVQFDSNHRCFASSVIAQTHARAETLPTIAVSHDTEVSRCRMSKEPDSAIQGENFDVSLTPTTKGFKPNPHQQTDACRSRTVTVAQSFLASVQETAAFVLCDAEKNPEIDDLHVASVGMLESLSRSLMENPLA